MYTILALYNNPSKDLHTLLILFFFLFIIYIRWNYYRYFIKSLQALYRKKIILELIEERNNYSANASLVSNIFSFFIIGYFLAVAGNALEIEWLNLHFIPVFILYSLSLFVFFGLKTMSYYFLAYILKSRNETQYYIYTVFNNLKVFGLLSFLFVVLIIYLPSEWSPFLIGINLGIYGILCISRFFVGAKIFISKHISIIYYILYLCTLEFLPFLIVVKILKGLIL